MKDCIVAVGTNVLVAGSVIVNQSRLRKAFEKAVHERHRHLAIQVLKVGPVEGAVFLARKTLVTASL